MAGILQINGIFMRLRVDPPFQVSYVARNFISVAFRRGKRRFDKESRIRKWNFVSVKLRYAVLCVGELWVYLNFGSRIASNFSPNCDLLLSLLASLPKPEQSNWWKFMIICYVTWYTCIKVLQRQLFLNHCIQVLFCKSQNDFNVLHRQRKFYYVYLENWFIVSIGWANSFFPPIFSK